MNNKDQLQPVLYSNFPVCCTTTQNDYVILLRNLNDARLRNTLLQEQLDMSNAKLEEQLNNVSVSKELEQEIDDRNRLVDVNNKLCKKRNDLKDRYMGIRGKIKCANRLNDFRKLTSWREKLLTTYKNVLGQRGCESTKRYSKLFDILAKRDMLTIFRDKHFYSNNAKTNKKRREDPRTKTDLKELEKQQKLINDALHNFGENDAILTLLDEKGRHRVNFKLYAKLFRRLYGRKITDVRVITGEIN